MFLIIQYTFLRRGNWQLLFPFSHLSELFSLVLILDFYCQFPIWQWLLPFYFYLNPHDTITPWRTLLIIKLWNTPSEIFSIENVSANRHIFTKRIILSAEHCHFYTTIITIISIIAENSFFALITCENESSGGLKNTTRSLKTSKKNEIKFNWAKCALPRPVALVVSHIILIKYLILNSIHKDFSEKFYLTFIQILST